MLSQEEFLGLIKAAGSDFYPPDDEQAKAVYADPRSDLFIVAGPGTGKTSCLSFRALYLIFVAGLTPRSIMATTFTKKAAAELRSRLLGWGYRLIDAATKTDLPQSKLESLKAIDLNQILTGTIDSLAENILREHRAAGEEPPVLADDYVTRTIMARDGLLDTKLYFSKSLDGLLGGWRGSTFGFNFSTKVDLLRTIADRRHNDLIDMATFAKIGPIAERKGRDRIQKVLAAYDAAVSDAGVLDFAQLERRLADGLKNGAYASFTKELKAILVDEYQDTNLLQETIYVLLARASGAPLSVVGDDDQSLYRFRGATVELFRDFPDRLKRELGRTPQPVFLTRNYRSAKRIVDFVASYGRLDPKFQQVRVAGKPIIRAYSGAPDGMPVLAMFRKDIDTLADDLSGFIHRVFGGNGFPIAGDKILKGNGGGLGDAALLCFSPAEDKGNRLPGKLRSRLGSLKPSIQVFNPRGEDFAEISTVQEFGGLLLECLDPKNDIARELKVSYEAKDAFAQWRICARQRLRSTGGDLRKYVNGWHNCNPGGGQKWPREVPAIDLVYALRHWFPEFQNDPEQQVYLETFTRQLQAAEEVSPFGGRAVWDSNEPHLHQRSIEHLLRNFLAPIADGSVGVNEELIETFPRDRLSVISIHQSKGLEFPLVIVDVGSRFKTDHHSQARFRFPTTGDLPHTLEDKMRPASSLKAPSRCARDRAFDDLYRLYYVAFSRARDVLLLVGLESDIPNVARGWKRTCSSAGTGQLPIAGAHRTANVTPRSAPASTSPMARLPA